MTPGFEPGEVVDWVLALDDAAKGYPPPGETKQNRAPHRPGLEESR